MALQSCGNSNGWLAIHLGIHLRSAADGLQDRHDAQLDEYIMLAK